MKKGYSGKPGNLTPLLDARGRPLYSPGLLWYRTPLFDFRADPVDPATFTDAAGTQFRPDNHFKTDGGSIPPATRVIPFAHLDPWNFPRGYPLHDGGYQYGGLYMKFAGEAEFRFRLMTRKQVDAAMADWLKYDGATWWDRRVILNGIALGSWTVWNSKKAAKQRAERKRAKIDVYSMAGVLIEDNGGRLLYESTLEG
jgi:hypothetical protein